MTGAMARAIVRTFRYVWPPLAWYYVVTLAIPLANGAASAGVTFVQHAAVVLLVPPLLIATTCAIFEMARWIGSKAASSASVKSDTPSRP